MVFRKAVMKQFWPYLIRLITQRVRTPGWKNLLRSMAKITRRMIVITRSRLRRM